MSQDYGVFYPSGLLDPTKASGLDSLLYQNFEILNESPAFTRLPSKVDGVPTTSLGPPTFGVFEAKTLWVDGFTAVWICTVSGNPGTWLQLEAPACTAYPASPPLNYRVKRADLQWLEYYWDGSAWTAVSGPGGGNTAANLGTTSDGLGWYASGSQFNFYRAKGGANITLAQEANDISIAVSSDPYFTGVTRVDYLEIGANSAPTAVADRSQLWVSASGTSPNRVVTTWLRLPDGTDAKVSSIIV